MSDVKIDRFWSHEASNIRCVREADYDRLEQECERLRLAVAELEEAREARVTQRLAAMDALLDERAAALKQVDELRVALTEVTATLAWNSFGECRAIHDGPIMPSAQAVEFARAALRSKPEQCSGCGQNHATYDCQIEREDGK